MKIEQPYEIRHKSHHNSTGLISKYYPPKRVSEDDFLKKLDEEPKDVPRVIYVHTPYCDKICSFCNLNREQLSGSLDSYAEYIAGEFDKYGKYRYFKEKPVDVIYFGGGTPTVYKAKQLEIILSSIERNIKLSADHEFTFETTLHNLTDEKLEIMEKYGVNRLSVGIQSFTTEGREFYNRTFDRDETIRRIKDLKAKFNGEVCVDIIYNYPNQTIENAVSDAKTIKELDLGSSSFYSLMIHNGSALSKDIENDKLKMEDDLIRERKLHDAFVDELTKENDYYILELTKIAKKNRDNYKYIKARSFGGDTFPIGVGAGGSVDNIGIFRMKKEMSMFVEKGEYQQRLDKVGGLFQFPVVEKKNVFPNLTEKELEIFKETIEKMKDKNLILENENNYSLTRDGLFWGNNVSREILVDLVEKTLGDNK